MLLPEDIRQNLAEQFTFAVERMVQATTTRDAPNQLYYFSAFYSELNRTFNRHWDPELALLHLVLHDTHNKIITRVSQQGAGVSPQIGVPVALLEELTRQAVKLTAFFHEDEVNVLELHAIETRISELAYVCTGNGFYLFQRGLIKI